MSSFSRSTHLSPAHYAFSWQVSTPDSRNDRQHINQLAIDYHGLGEGPDKEAILLKIVQSFHGYLCKYLSMIRLGRRPSSRTRPGKEAAVLLAMLVKRGRRPTAANLSKTCKSMHLAFKQHTADDIYDILALCLMRAVRNYDPHYTTKVRQICEVIDDRFKRGHNKGVFTAEEVSQAIGYDALRYLRLLVKRGSLESVAGPKKKVLGYKRGKKWPLPPAFFQSGPIGFVYYLPLYFRWYLHEHISTAMDQIESDEGMLQLGHTGSEPGRSTGIAERGGTPHAEGTFVSADGSRWAADTALMRLKLDVSAMTLDWVNTTSDRLFRKLTRSERYILYMVFVKEYSWVEIAATLSCDPQTAKREYDGIMFYLRGRAQSGTRTGLAEAAAS